VEGLKFVTGVAENPPFADNSFDIVVNVESARCYKSIKTFFEQVHRMLRQGGHFCFADMIKKGEHEEMRANLLASGMEILSETNISQNVVMALDLDNERRESIISGKVPKFLKKAFFQFAGTKGTERYESFANGKMEYWHFVLRKV
jgi:ubiquinone/menaquinone biosynthesis C-methylase UbiE